MPKELVQGKSVKLGDFGSFRLSLSSDGAETEEQFNATMIKNAKIIFTPGTQLKSEIAKVKYERE